MPASFPRVRSEETGTGTARPQAPRVWCGSAAKRQRREPEAFRAGETGMRKRDVNRFRPPTNPRGQAPGRSRHARTHRSHSAFPIPRSQCIGASAAGRQRHAEAGVTETSIFRFSGTQPRALCYKSGRSTAFRRLPDLTGLADGSAPEVCEPAEPGCAGREAEPCVQAGGLRAAERTGAAHRAAHSEAAWC
jgi:hypothetical protein